MAIIPGDATKSIAIETPQKQKMKNLAIILVTVLVLTGAIIYFNYGNNPVVSPAALETTVVDEQTVQTNKILDSLRNVSSLNNPIFSDKLFQSLVLSNNLPISVGEKGRENPFASF